MSSIPLTTDVEYLWSKIEHDTVKCLINPDILKVPERWKGYAKLVEKGIYSEHKLVNHCKNYVDTVKGMSVNGIEGQWTILKRHISKHQRTDEFLDDCLLEKVWRHRNKDKLWERLGQALEIVMCLDNNSNDDNEEQETNMNVVQA